MAANKDSFRLTAALLFTLLFASCAFGLHRDSAAKRRFMRETGYPHGRRGYVVDHVVPLACGGPDEPSNMQWQTTLQARRKDRVERRDCTRLHKGR